MVELKVRLRKWGNSFGIVVPQKVVVEEKVKEGDEVTILFKKEGGNVLRESFGTFKFKKPINKLLKEVDRELWSV